MKKNIIIGIIVGVFIGIFVTSFFVSNETTFSSIFLSKITATSIITGVFTGIYATLSKSKLQVFLISIIIGIAVFYLKYFVTGHHFDPLTMGAFVGAMLGGAFAVEKKIINSRKIYSRLKRFRKSNFKSYSDSKY